VERIGVCGEKRQMKLIVDLLSRDEGLPTVVIIKIIEALRKWRIKDITDLLERKGHSKEITNVWKNTVNGGIMFN